MADGKHLRIQSELFPDRFTSTFTDEPSEELTRYIGKIWYPLTINYLRKDFDDFYDKVLKHTKAKEIKEHLIEYKERFVFTFLGFITADLLLSTIYKKYKNDKAGLEMFYSMEFDKCMMLTNIVFAGLIGDLDHLEKLNKMDRKKYPDDLFTKANDIYKEAYNFPQKLTYDKALFKAAKSYKIYSELEYDSVEFGKMNESYKKSRAGKKIEKSEMHF